MIKDWNYYKGLNLSHYAKSWRASEEKRDSEAFHDLLAAIAFRCKEEEYTTERILFLIGEPDQKQRLKSGEEVWEYHWEDSYGMISYTSCTPFLIKDEKVIGLRKRQQG